MRSRGFSLVEVMVSLAVIGVAAGLIFGVQMRMTGALRDQQNVSEVQQTLRSASTVISKDLRTAGYLSNTIFWNWEGTPSTAVLPVRVTNGNPDSIELLTAVDDCPPVRVCDSNALFCPNPGHTFGNNQDGIEVDDPSCFHTNDLIIGVRTLSITGTTPVPAGTGCVLQVTGAPIASSPGLNAVIQTSELSPTTWNPSGNDQCRVSMSGALNTVWDDGYTMVKHFRDRTYRIKPSDVRGVLQLCDKNPALGATACSGTSADWQDVALGIVDLQVALRVAHDGVIEWLSGNNMNYGNIAGLGTPQILMASITIVAKSTKGVEGPVLTEVPTLMDPSVASATNNPLSDRGAVALPVSSSAVWPLTMYDDEVVYRIYTTTIDLRNVGVGTTESAPAGP